MAGLTEFGFLPDSLSNIKGRIEGKLEQFNAGFDFDPESPDGQLIGIMSAELALLWDELNKVYRSYDPNTAQGQALRNLALITGVPFKTATRSYSTVSVTGVAGTNIPEGSLVSNLAGDSFYTNALAIIPTDVTVLAVTSGEVPTDVANNAIVSVDTAITGWDGVVQTTDGVVGTNAVDEGIYRNYRNKTVLRNNIASEENLKGVLLEKLGLEQVRVVNNDTLATLADGTPPRAIHVLVGEQGSALDADIAKYIYINKGLGVITHGTTSVQILDTESNIHTIKFTKSAPINIYAKINVTFLSSDFAGAELDIKNSIVDHINSLLVGEDVIWSRLFEFVTPFGKAQVNSLTVSRDNVNFSSANVVLGENESALCSVNNITVTVV